MPNDERAFYGLTLPFEPTRLREASDRSQGVHCTCPKCSVEWILSFALDLHDAEKSEQPAAPAFAMATALAKFLHHSNVKRAEVVGLVGKAFDAISDAAGNKADDKADAPEYTH